MSEQTNQRTEQRTKACGSCPFSRKCEPGALGGSPITVYLGQSIGPFFLPCHSAKGYRGNDERMDGCGCHCAGAAIFRANIQVDQLMPEPLLKLPAGSDENVFESMQDFIMHHHPEMRAHEARGLEWCAPSFTMIELEKALVGGKGEVKTL